MLGGEVERLGTWLAAAAGPGVTATAGRAAAQAVMSSIVLQHVLFTADAFAPEDLVDVVVTGLT